MQGTSPTAAGFGVEGAREVQGISPTTAVLVLGGCWERCKELVVFISEQIACEANWGTLTAAADGMGLEARWLLEQGVNISPVRGELAGLLNGL